MTGFASRLADCAWDLAYGKGEIVLTLCRVQGKTIKEFGGAAAVSDGRFTAGLHLANRNPVDSLIQVCMALFGPMWPTFVSDDFTRARKEIERRWKQKREEAKK